MKNLFLVLFILTTTYSQQFNSLDGIEDSQGNTILLYRYGSNYFLFNPIYKLNTSSLDEALLIQAYYNTFPGGDLAKAVNDFEFFPNDENNFMNVGYEINPDNHSYIARNDSIVYGEIEGFERVDISKQDPQKVFVFGYNYTLRSFDGGFTFPADSVYGPGGYSRFWISEFDDEIYFGLNVDVQLIRNSQIVDTAKIFFNENTKLLFDVNQFHIYRTNKTYWGYTFNVSNNKGNAFTWTETYRSENPIYISIDSTQSGVIYLADGRKIYKSVNNGYDFVFYKSLPSKLVGIYKKPSSEILYAASKNTIFKITPDSISIIKSLPFPEEEYSWFPLAVGNIWVYDEYWTEYWGGFPVVTYAGTKYMKVTKDTLIENKNYFVVENEYISFEVFAPKMFLRVDSLTGLIYRYWTELNDEYLFHNLNPELGDTIFYPPYPENPYYIFEYEQPINYLGINTLERRYWEALPCGCFHTLVKGFGLARTVFNEFGGSEDILKGCVLNGIVFGDTTFVGVDEEENLIPTEYKLQQNYPNPFNPSTKIKYSIPSVISTEGRNLKVTLRVYDVLGKEVATLVNEEKPAGNYEVEFNAAHLPSGVYFYQLKAGGFVETKKMMVVK